MLRGNRWLRRFHAARDDRPTVVFFPHAGGSASFFRPYSEALSAHLNVVCVQYPGRQDRHRESLIDDIDELAERICHETSDMAATAGPDLPPAFFGHSMGAVVAFEVAHRLEKRTGRGPSRLFVSGRRAPSRFGAAGEPVVHLMNDLDVIEHMRRSGATSSQLLAEPDMLRVILPVVRNDYRAIETYRCQPGRRVSCPVSILVGDSDPMCTVDDALAWQEHTAGESDISVFPAGGHFYLAPAHPDVVRVIRHRMTGDRPHSRSVSVLSSRTIDT